MIDFYGKTISIFSICFSALLIPTILLIISVASTLVFLHYLNTRNSETFELENYSERTDILASYIVPYVFPFLSIDILSVKGALIFGVIMASLMVVQIQSSRLYTNPFLAMLGFRILEANVEGRDGTSLLILRSRDYKTHGEVNVVKVGDNLLFEKGDSVLGW